MKSHSRNEIKLGADLGPEFEKICSRISELTIDHELRVHGGSECPAFRCDAVAHLAQSLGLKAGRHGYAILRMMSQHETEQVAAQMRIQPPMEI